MEIASAFVIVIGAAIVTKNTSKTKQYGTNSYHVILNEFKLRRYVLGLEKLYKLVPPKKP